MIHYLDLKTKSLLYMFFYLLHQKFSSRGIYSNEMVLLHDRISLVYVTIASRAPRLQNIKTININISYNSYRAKLNTIKIPIQIKKESLIEYYRMTISPIQFNPLQVHPDQRLNLSRL